MKLFNSFTLKMMAIIFMAMDHIYTLLSKPLDGAIPIWFGYFGKLAAPIFFYLIVEGFFHTRSRVKYMKRLFGMAIVMIGIDMLFGLYNNIFLSLGCAVALMSAIEYVKTQKVGSVKFIAGIVVTILIAVLSVFTEASIYGLGMTLIFYFFRDKKIIMAIAYVIFSLYGLLSVIGPNFYQASFIWDYQWMMVFAIIPIMLYNGKLGLSNKVVKWLFYWFYPVHLAALTIIAKLLA